MSSLFVLGSALLRTVLSSGMLVPARKAVEVSPRTCAARKVAGKLSEEERFETLILTYEMNPMSEFDRRFGY